MREILSIILISISICLGCKVERSGIKTIDLLSGCESEMTNLSEIATELTYIPLQTTDSSLISRISDMKVRGNNIYIRSFDRILCFTAAGKFLCSLNKRGRGPEEYDLFTDFDIDPTNSLLALKTRANIIFYNLTNNGFQFKDRISIPTVSLKINFVGSDKLLLQYSNENGTRQFSLQMIDLKGKILFQRPNYLSFTLKDGYVSASSWESSSYRYNNNLLIKELMTDTLFKVNSDGVIIPYEIFDTKDKRITPEARSNGKYYTDHLYEYFLLQKIMESDKYFYFTTYYNKEPKAFLYDKESGLKYNISVKSFLKDDLAGGVNFEPRYCDNGYFYSWMDAITLKKKLSDVESTQSGSNTSLNNNSMKNILNNLSEYDNPVLIKVKIK